MGFPTVSVATPAVAAIPTQSRKRLLFVSYSHSDSGRAKRFLAFLRVQSQSLRERGRVDWEIFFDHDQIRAGEDWGDALLDTLSQADLLVFLISVDSLNSKACHAEVATAMERKIPVVPVLLSSCPWIDCPIPGDARQRTFGDVDILPKDAFDRTLRVSAWGSQEDAWDAVLTGLDPWLKAPGPLVPAEALPALAATASARSPRYVPPLLPYLCNQKKIWEKFDLAIGQWRKQQGRALVVIVKGTHLDEPKQFWNRLRENHVAQLLKIDKSALVDADLEWPDLQDGRLRPDVVAEIVRMKLSSALTEDHDPYEIDSSERLAQELAKLTRPRPLVADFPDESPAALKTGLRALLGLLDACPEGANLSHLLIVVMAIDQPDLFAISLVDRWRLATFRRSTVVEVGPLLEVTSKHAAEWHEDQRLERDWQLRKQRVLDLFKTASTMRAGQFAAAVRPMLEFPDGSERKEAA